MIQSNTAINICLDLVAISHMHIHKRSISHFDDGIHCESDTKYAILIHRQASWVRRSVVYPTGWRISDLRISGQC